MIMSDQNQQTAIHKDEKTQKWLNEPLKYAGSSQNRDFLEMLMKMINEGKIQLLQPASLINHQVYDKIDQKAQGKADYEAMNLLHVVREIKGLYDAGYKDTYQMDNLVEKLRVTKERLESQDGDLFII